jgi:hypothetical protein
MSSKITVYFQHPEGDEPEFKAIFSVRHLRNYKKNENGGLEIDQYGGYTVLSQHKDYVITEDGPIFNYSCNDLIITKCNPRTDKFSRNIGLSEAIKCWMNKAFDGKYTTAYDLRQNWTIRPVGVNEFVQLYIPV